MVGTSERLSLSSLRVEFCLVQPDSVLSPSLPSEEIIDNNPRHITCLNLQNCLKRNVYFYR